LGDQDQDSLLLRRNDPWAVAVPCESGQSVAASPKDYECRIDQAVRF
jgi:hypothetical protein